MHTITNTFLWRKATAWAGIMAILSTMLLTMPIPQVEAAPVAANSGNAVYIDSNANTGNTSTITATFSEALTNASGRQGDGNCDGKPTPPNSYCYDYSGANLILGGARLASE